MAKFKVGDKVILKSSVIPNLAYNTIVVSDAILRDFSEVNYGIIKTYDELYSTYEVYLADYKHSWWIGEDALELYQPSIPEYKVGDKVRIKKMIGKPYDYPCCFVNSMFQQEGRIFTIADIEELMCENLSNCKFYNGDNHCYYLKEDSDKFIWHSSMFEPVTENKTVGDSLRDEKEIKTSSLTINNYENEIRFQKPKASFTRGHVPTGHSICGRQHKITVVIGHLSNQAISC